MRQGKIKLIPANTPRNTGGAVDGNMMRRLAIELNIPFVTMAGARIEFLQLQKQLMVYLSQDF